jgi:hypothetical protein
VRLSDVDASGTLLCSKCGSSALWARQKKQRGRRRVLKCAHCGQRQLARTENTAPDGVSADTGQPANATTQVSLFEPAWTGWPGDGVERPAPGRSETAGMDACVVAALDDFELAATRLRRALAATIDAVPVLRAQVDGVASRRTTAIAAPRRPALPSADRQYPLEPISWKADAPDWGDDR